jgi:hypothetical protein
MPAQAVQVVGGVASPEAYVQQCSHFILEDSVLWEVRWCYQGRSPSIGAQWDHRTFVANGSWWPMLNTRGIMGDDTAYCLCPGEYDPWQYGLGGSQSRKYIMGLCQDSSLNPMGGVIVQAFRTSDDAYDGEGVSDSNGRYEVQCVNYPNDAHYLVATYGTPPTQGGTTVNTLTPRWRDGT